MWVAYGDTAERDRAWFHLGMADGCVAALFDTPRNAYAMRTRVNRLRIIFGAPRDKGKVGS
jgi:hypothetical protein